MSFHDFDAAFREAKKTGPQFRLFGGDYELPASIPLGAVLEVQRMQRADAEEEANIVGFFDRVIGPAKWRNAPEGWTPKPGYTAVSGDYVPSALTQYLLDCGLTSEQMTELLSWALSQYGAAPKTEEAAAPLVQKAAPKPRTPRGRVRR